MPNRGPTSLPVRPESPQALGASPYSNGPFSSCQRKVGCNHSDHAARPDSSRVETRPQTRIGPGDNAPSLALALFVVIVGPLRLEELQRLGGRTAELRRILEHRADVSATVRTPTSA